MPGRKPKPTALKLITGNPGKRPLNKAEPKPAGEPERPAYLSGRAAALWDEYAPQLVTIGVLTAADSAMFSAWCALMAQFEADPVGISANRISQMRGLASSFGLDASARSRMAVEPPKKQGEAWDRFKKPA